MEWNWLEFVEEVDTRWVEQGEGSGLYELIFLVRADHQLHAEITLTTFF